MMWVAWRQQRVQLLVSLGVVVAMAAVVLYIRWDVMSTAASIDAQACLTGGHGCSARLIMKLRSARYQYATMFQAAMLMLPLVLGVFAGAPLFAREAERGTHTFALTQSVSRTRWWAVKLAIAGAPVTIAMLGFGLFSRWALAPLSALTEGVMQSPNFETGGVTVMAYTMLAVTVGATVGLLARNTMVTIAITLAVFLAVSLGVANLARPNYVDPETATRPVSADVTSGLDLIPESSLRVSEGYLDRDGNETSPDCHPVDLSCMRNSGVEKVYATFHSPKHFWPWQWIESAILAVISVLTLAIGAVGLRKRAT